MANEYATVINDTRAKSTRYYYWSYWGLFLNVNPVNQQINASNIVGVGYSGNAQMLNEPSLSYLIDKGCIPAGRYIITLTDDEKGLFTHHLTPDKANAMFGRSGFLNHGDNKSFNHTASDGCIVSPVWTRMIFKVWDEIVVV